MYTPVKIEKLSDNQKSKLRRGLPVRVKHDPRGSDVVHCSSEQCKKIARAYKKGSAVVLQMDPYQQAELKGSGLFDSAKKAASKALAQGKKQALSKGKQLAAQKLQEGASHFTTAVMPKYIEQASNMADRKVRIAAKDLQKNYLRDDEAEYWDAPFDDYDTIGQGFGQFMKKVGKVAKPIAKIAEPVVKKLGNKVVEAGVQNAMMAMAGGALRPAGRGRGRPRRGGALRPA